MSAKNTFSQGRHPSRSAYGSIHLHLGNEDRKVMEHLVSKTFSDDEVAELVREIEVRVNFRPPWTLSRQEVIKSLSDISRLEPEAAATALRKVDTTTRRLIKDALWSDLDQRKLGMIARRNPNPDLIPKAAEIALSRFKAIQSPGGRPVNSIQRLLASFSLELWRKFGQSDERTEYSGASPYANSKVAVTPLMAWTAAIFRTAKEKDNNSQMKKLLRELKPKLD